MASETESGADFSEAGLGALVREFLTHLERLGRLYWRLAQVQAHGALTRIQRGLLLMVFAILIGLLGALALVAAMMMGLATFLPGWVAAGIVGIGLFTLAMALFTPARRALSLSEPLRTGVELFDEGNG